MRIGAERGMRNVVLEATGANDVCLRVEFVWHGDRYGHLVSIIDSSGQPLPLLESIEGTPSDNWPPSPPLQSLSIETLPDGRRAALLVGMAGGSHWSASVEAASDEASIRFDVACRMGSEGALLGNRYSLASPNQGADLFVAADDSWAQARLGQLGVVVVPDYASLTKILRFDAQGFALAAQRPSQGRNLTIRWKYEILAVSDS
jgi:hypothetical protein